MARPINVMLYLSSAVKPHPDDEIYELEQLSSSSDVTAFVTTRFVAPRLREGLSQIAFYTNSRDGFELLGHGIFRRFVSRTDPKTSSDSQEWKAILAQHPLYQLKGFPETSIGFLLLSNIRMAESRYISSLGGFVENGRPLNDDTLREIANSKREHGTNRSAVFYVVGEEPPSSSEKEELLRAKKEELEPKVLDYSRTWKREQRRAVRAEERADKIASRLASSKVLRPVSENVQQRFEQIIRERYSNLEFRDGSETTLIARACQSETVWRVLAHLNEFRRAPSTLCEVKRFQGTKCWWEAKPTNALRIYWRDGAASETDARIWILVDEKTEQEGRSTRFMKRYDTC
jgi:hypothetical protein